MNRKTVEIQCTGAATLPLDQIIEFQGTLKNRTKKDLEKIKKSILKYGFSFPFFVWRSEGINHCMDGHGRLQALKELGESMELPEFPVSWVEAKNSDEAKQKLLRLNSQYGEMTVESVLEFTAGLEMEWDDLELTGKYTLVLEEEPYPQKESSGSQEVDVEEFHLQCKCPRCGMEFTPKAQE